MSLLFTAEELLARGEEEKARALALRYRLVPGQTAEEYLRWGALCEDLALPRQALECYQKALAVFKDHPQALLALAALQYELGDLYAAKRTVKRLLRRKPGNRTARELLARIYQELGEEGSLAVLTGETKEEVSAGPRYFPPSLGKRDLEAFEPFLQGSRAHAELLLNPATGAPVFLYRERPLTPEDLRAHLLGQRYLAFFPIDEECRVRVAYLTILVPERERARHAREKSWLYLKAEAVRHLALKALKTAGSEYLPAGLEKISPYRYRLWFILSEAVHFLWLRRFLKALVERLPYPEEGVSYLPEAFTEPVGLGWRERAVILPLGRNPVTKEQALFVDEEGQPYPEQLSFLKKWRALSPEELRIFCRKGELRWEVRTASPLDDLLRRLLEGCPVIEALVQKVQAGRRLSREEKLALFLTVGLLDTEGRLLHEVLHPCPDYRYSRVERQRRALPPNPVSCYKLRRWFPGLTAALPCHCAFENAEERYPSPLLHVSPILVPPEEETLSKRYRRITDLARLYDFYLKERERLDRRLSKLSQELESYLKAHPGKRLPLRGKRYLLYEAGKLQVKEEA